MPKGDGVIYFFYGENDFAKKRAAAELSAEFLSAHGDESVAKIDAAEADAPTIFREIFNVSLFAPQRFITVLRADENRDFWTKLDDNLPRMLAASNDVLLLAGRPDKRTKTFKNLLKTATVREFPPLKSFEIAKAVQDEAQRLNLKIAPDAAAELAAACSDDQWRIHQELLKLANLHRAIDTQIIREFVQPDLATNAFTVLENALLGRFANAAREIDKLRLVEDANKFLGLLASQIFALAGAVFANADAAKDLKIHPFQLAKMRELANKLGDPSEQKIRIKKVIQILAATDAKLKTSAGDGWILIKTAFAKM
jgi:DNA polymerase III delta subunit